MKKEKLQYSNITIAEHWQPSVQLRWIERSIGYFKVPNSDEGFSKTEKTLQQLFTSNLGNREWKDVPIETES